MSQNQSSTASSVDELCTQRTEALRERQQAEERERDSRESSQQSNRRN